MKLQAFLLMPIIAGIICLCLTIGCSTVSENPVTPATINYNPANINPSETNRILWGIWEFTLDESLGQLIPVPLREAYAHFDITPMLLPPNCTDCLEISIGYFDYLTHTLHVDVLLRNSTPYTGHDVRGIIYTDDYGHELCYPDDWTGLWDIPGGQAFNPFIAFAKQVPDRAVTPSSLNSEEYLICIPEWPHCCGGIKFAIDASWPGNCKEPSEITNFWQENIFDNTGSSGNIYVDICDWQGDVNEVTLSAPAITGEEFTQLTYFAGITWTLKLTNQLGLPAGQYQARFNATSTGSGSLALYDFVNITISTAGVPQNPLDVTPPGLEDYPARSVCVDGSFLYAACQEVGLEIFDISIPSNPVWLNLVDTPVNAQCVAVSGGYAYVGDASYGFLIIDIDPLESAYIYKHIDTPGWAWDVALSDGYAYVADASNGLQIIDIDPPESAYICCSVATTDNASGVAVLGNYAYVADDWDGLHIVDICIPESAHIVKSLKTPGEAFGIAISNGYAYIAGYQYGLVIVDVDPIESTCFVTSVSMSPLNVSVSGAYAYVAAGFAGLNIIDIEIPESAYLLSSVPIIGGTSKDVVVDDNYAYVAADIEGVRVIKLW